MEELKKVEASWSVNLYVDCPHCNEFVDIFQEWSEQEMWGSVDIGETKELDDGDFDVTCPKCKKDFGVSNTTH
jgi:phage FluMu protein Com